MNLFFKKNNVGSQEKLSGIEDKEKIYKILYESSSDAIMTLEPPDWRFTSGNPATVKIFNVKDEKELISLPPWELSPKYQSDGQLSSEEAKKNIERAMKEGSFLFEWEHKRYKGEVFPVTVLLTKINVSGKEMLQATVRDVSKQKETEKALRSSEARYKTLFANAAEGIIMADEETKQFRYCNLAICKMLGYAEEELTHLGIGDIHPKEALGYVTAEFEALAQGKKKFTEVPCLRKDGTVFYASIVESEIFIDGHKYILGFFTDITERKKSDEFIKEKIEELEEINKLMVDRELKMIELKEEIESLKKK